MTSYRGVIRMVDNLPALLRHQRLRRGLSMREAADEIGVAASTLCRLESQKPGSVPVALMILHWLDRNDSA